MIVRLSHRSLVCALLVGLCLVVPGCPDSRINKTNADKITTGMTESEVTAMLGPPTMDQEVGMPNLGGLPGGGGFPGGGDLPVGMPKKIRQCIWKSGTRSITVQFLDGKVTQKMTTGL